MWCPSMKWLESKILQSVTLGSKAMAGRTLAIRTLAPSDPWVLSFIRHHRNIQKSYSNYSQYVPWLQYTPTINGIDTEIKVKNKISYSTRKVIMIPVKRSTGSLTAALWKVGETAPICSIGWETFPSDLWEFMGTANYTHTSPGACLATWENVPQRLM